MHKQRRRAERAKKRVPVRFARSGQSGEGRGFTRDISRYGMFIQTRHPLPPGSRVDVELLYKDRPVSLSGVVVHASRIPPHLQGVRASGMGVKTLQPSEKRRGGPLPSATAPASAGDRPAPEPDGLHDRRPDRVDPSTRVAVYFGSERRNLELRSLSSSGAAVISPEPLPNMPFVRLHFRLAGNRDLVVDGVPVRSEEVDSGVLLALQFLDPPADVVADIEEFVTQHRLRRGATE